MEDTASTETDDFDGSKETENIMATTPNVMPDHGIEKLFQQIRHVPRGCSPNQGCDRSPHTVNSTHTSVS